MLVSVQSCSPDSVKKSVGLNLKLRNICASTCNMKAGVDSVESAHANTNKQSIHLWECV